jgi:hypothetical protein
MPANETPRRLLNLDMAASLSAAADVESTGNSKDVASIGRFCAAVGSSVPLLGSFDSISPNEVAKSRKKCLPLR